MTDEHKKKASEAAEEFIPLGFNLQNIGKPVSIQVFDRSYEERGTIIPSSLKKYVGILEMWFFEYGKLGFKLVGGEPQYFDLEHRHVELYTND